MSGNSDFVGRKVAFHTLGCKLNFVESGFIAEQLLQAGFERAADGEPADVCVVNTCSVTEIADRKGRQAIGQLHRANPGALIVVTGCYAQLRPDDVAAIEGVDIVLGMQDKFDILPRLRQSLLKRPQPEVAHTLRKDINAFLPSCTRGDRTRFFLKVQDGCDYFCTYCTIPIARGRSRSASVADTVAVTKRAALEGAKEVVITGVNIGDFGHGSSEDFFDLVRALDSIEGIRRYRISSIEPDLLTNEIVDFCAQSQKFVPHFHIPLQSGSDSVLRLMHRRYDSALYASRVNHILSVMPDAFIGVDVIVGTKGESDDLFQQGYDFIASLPVAQLHVFSYSERPGTAALKMSGAVPAAVKKERSEALHLLSEQKRLAFYNRFVGSQRQVLWEEKSTLGLMHGFTDNYIRLERTALPSLVNQVETVTLGPLNADSSALRVAL